MKLVSAFRSLVMTLLYPIVLVFFSALAILVNLVFNNRNWDDQIAILWGAVSCAMFSVKVRLRGQENIPTGGCIYLFNHTSFFDIFAMQATLRGFRFGAKIELFKIPVFGAAMRRMGALPIARERRDEVFKIYKMAESRIRNGEKFALAPEGTRQIEEKLGAFKSGPFVFAINAKAPLVPVVIRGASKVLHKGKWFPNFDVWSREILIDVLPAVETVGYETKDRPILQEKIRNEMVPYFTNDHS